VFECGKRTLFCAENVKLFQTMSFLAQGREPLFTQIVWEESFRDSISSHLLLI
jgi:hypothetical protein